MRIVQRNFILLIIVYMFIDSGYAQTDNDYGSIQFRCDNGEYIDYSLLCNGKADCKDSSDETIQCKKILCFTHAFRCNYGACVHGGSECNGIRDCVDNSDETQCEIKNATGDFSHRCKPHDQFMCSNHQCISSLELCDGIRNCADGSDETAARCGSVFCPASAFRCAYGACIDGNLRCNEMINCADGSDEDSTLCARNGWWKSLRPTTEPTRYTPIHPVRNSCRAPPQPTNGRWQLYQSQCPGEECSVSEGTELELGSYLVYSCNSGYKIRGPTDVTCIFGGKWLNIPDCIEIRCRGLTTASIYAKCRHNGAWKACETPVPPGTTAELSCQNSYQPVTYILSRQRRNVICNRNGEWEPKPMRCIPDPLSINIYINDTKLAFHTTFNRNNATFIEVLDDRVIIHTNANNHSYPNIDVEIPKPNNNIAIDKPWAWS